MPSQHSDFLPAPALMRLLDISICAAAKPEHSKKALEVAEAVSKLLIGPRMDFALGSVMWMAGEQQAAAEVLERVANDPEVGTSAKAMLAMLLATEGNEQWREWSKRAEASRPDSLHSRMLLTAEEIATVDPTGSAAEQRKPAMPTAPMSQAPLPTARLWA